MRGRDGVGGGGGGATAGRRDAVQLVEGGRRETATTGVAPQRIGRTPMCLKRAAKISSGGGELASAGIWKGKADEGRMSIGKWARAAAAGESWVVVLAVVRRMMR